MKVRSFVLRFLNNYGGNKFLLLGIDSNSCFCVIHIYLILTEIQEKEKTHQNASTSSGSTNMYCKY